jgi:hypothetical protein
VGRSPFDVGLLSIPAHQNFLDFDPNLEPHWQTLDLRSIAWPDPAVVGFIDAPPLVTWENRCGWEFPLWRPVLLLAGEYVGLPPRNAAELAVQPGPGHRLDDPRWFKRTLTAFLG